MWFSPDDVHPPRLGFKQSALTMYGLAACLFGPGIGPRQTFTQHAIVPSSLSVEGKLLLYSRCLSETALYSER
jgi:hypothetical protein